MRWTLGQFSGSSHRYLTKAALLIAELMKPPRCLYDERFSRFRASQVINSSSLVVDGSGMRSCHAMYGCNGVESTAAPMAYW